MTTTTTTPTSTGTNASLTPVQGTGTVASQQLAGNFDTFLQMLTTQLQNQDPLDPLDSNSFTQELVEFASVEQQINTNTNLQTLISLQQTSEATSAMQLLGANVTINSNTAALSNATGAPATWDFSVPSPATGTVTITSSTGQTAYTGTVSLNAGNQTYTWNGQGTNGATWPDGDYNISISATGANGQPVSVTTQVQGTISAVNINTNPPQVTVAGQSYPITSILSINSSGSSNSTSVIQSLGGAGISIGNLGRRVGNLAQFL